MKESWSVPSQGNKSMCRYYAEEKLCFQTAKRYYYYYLSLTILVWAPP